MKIAHISCVAKPYRGGIGETAFLACKELCKLGYQADLITPRYTSDLLEEEIIDGVKIFRRKTYFKLGKSAMMYGLKDIFKKYDIVHLHYPFFGSAEILFLIKFLFGFKTKIIVTYHMDVYFTSWLKYLMILYNLFVMPNIIRFADMVVVSSFDYIKNSKAKRYFYKYQKKFVEIPFCVDSIFINTPIFKDVQIQNKKRILFVGGMDKAHYFKGVNVLLDAIKKLDESYNCVLVGDGEMKFIYQKYAQGLGLNNRVDFVGRVSDIDLVKFYDLCNVFVLPSTYGNESFGLVLIQAMARRKPVIASNLPGVRSVVQDGKNGLLAKPNNFVELAGAIKKICEDKNLSKTFGEYGFECIRKLYSLEKYGNSLLNIYTKLV